MRPVRHSIAALFVLLVSAVSAMAQDWIAAQVAQPTHYTLDAQTWREVAPGMAIPSAAWIQTGRRGRVILQRGRETIQFRPSTVAAITSRSGGLTDVRQKTGSLLLDLQTRATRHTSVETPFLAAVVKGTRFEVSVSRGGAALRVEEGLVEATHLARGEQVDVRAGQSVEVSQDASQPMAVVGAGPVAPVLQVAPVAPSVAPAMTPREAERAQANGGTGAPVSASQRDADARSGAANGGGGAEQGEGRGGEISGPSNAGGLVDANGADVVSSPGGAAAVTAIATGSASVVAPSPPQGPRAGAGNGPRGSGGEGNGPGQGAGSENGNGPGGAGSGPDRNEDDDDNDGGDDDDDDADDGDNDNDD